MRWVSEPVCGRDTGECTSRGFRGRDDEAEIGTRLGVHSAPGCGRVLASSLHRLPRSMLATVTPSQSFTLAAPGASMTSMDSWPARTRCKPPGIAARLSRHTETLEGRMRWVTSSRRSGCGAGLASWSARRSTACPDGPRRRERCARLAFEPGPRAVLAGKVAGHAGRMQTPRALRKLSWRCG